MTSVSVVFAGGGSGGHIFPGLAIADALRDLAGDDARILFLCSQRAIDAQILSAAGETFETIPARPFSVRPRGFANFASSWPAAVRSAKSSIREFIEDAQTSHLIAVGGFAAAPAVRAATKLRIPVTMLNLDAVPGKANRWIASQASRVLTTMDVNQSDWTRIAPIVRAGVVSDDTPAECRSRFGLDPDLRTLLVTGGSQGAGTINQLMASLCANSPEALDSWQVIHQAGSDAVGDLAGSYAQADVRACVRPFIDDMASALAAADLGVSRAGAGSVAEARSARLPTLFMPYPFHRDQHQKLNAQPLVDAGAAVLADDLIDQAQNARTIGVMLSELLNDDRARASMRDNLAALGSTDGAETVAGLILGR